MSNVEFLQRSEKAAEHGRAREAGRGFVTPAAATQILSIARRRKWVILGAIVVGLVASLLATLLMTPKYTANAVVEIRREGSNFTQMKDADQSSTNVDWEFYDTQYGLLTARSLAEHVATELKLQDNRQFFEMFVGAKSAKLFPGNVATPGLRADRVRVAGSILLGHVEIVPREHSRLVGIRFTSPDPAISQAVVNGWAEGFIRMTLDRRFEATAYARKFLESRLDQLRNRIDESERRLVSYAAQEGIVNLPVQTGGDGNQGTAERSLAVDDITRLNQALAEATAQRIEAQSRLNSAGGNTMEAVQNAGIGALRQRRAELASDYAKMMVQFEPQYPPAVALQSQIKQMDQAIAREEGRVKSSLRDTYTASVEREKALSAKVNGLKGDILDLRRRSIQYNIYQRDVDTTRQLYDALLQRYKEIGVAGGVGVNNISVVDVAQLPTSPSSPKIFINVLLGLVAGFAIGVGIAFALEQIDQGISDPTEVENELGVPLLGTIPKSAGGNPTEELEDRKSTLTEAYHSLQTSLSFSTDHGIPKTLAVTSSRPAEGKTTTAFALARSIAGPKRKVLLIDADMRSPSIHHLLDLSNSAGLSNYLSGAGDSKPLIRETRHEGLWAMPAGPQPPSAPELLNGGRMHQLIEELLHDFSHVVIDAPPVMGLADAPLIANMVEATVFVVESNGTQKGMARVAIGRLRASAASVVGAVLTKFDARRAHYGYGYDYGYGYGYSEEGGSKKPA